MVSESVWLRTGERLFSARLRGMMAGISGVSMKQVYVIIVFLALCAIVLAWRRFGVRPAGVPSTAVRVDGNYIDCISHKLPVEHPCTVYKGSTGEVLDNQPITARLKFLSSRHGGSLTDCGRTPTRNPDPLVSECGQAAFQNRKPFYVQYYSTLAVFSFAYGLAGDANGNVSSVVYDSMGFPSVAPTRHTQVLDQNHTRVTACIEPVTLGNTEEGLLACTSPVNEKESAIAAEQKPIETTVCAVTENPAAFNNRMVRVRGHVSGNFEYSMLDGDGCTDSIWFAYGTGASPPGLVAYVPGGAIPGGEDSEGKRILPVPVKVIRNSNFDRFQRLMNARVKADALSEKSNADKFVFHRVTATFVGRIDAVSPEVHALHLKRPPVDKADFLGFGQMGLFDAQLVVQSIENDAVLDKEPPSSGSPKR